jgi:hypothetical protein
LTLEKNKIKIIIMTQNQRKEINQKKKQKIMEMKKIFKNKKKKNY